MKTLKLTLITVTCLFLLIGSKTLASSDFKVTANNAVFTAQKVPVSMDKEHVYTISYTVKNTGDNTWKTGDYKLKVTVTPSSDVLKNKWLIPNVDIPNDIAPGSEVTLTFKVTAWNEDGTYNF